MNKPLFSLVLLLALSVTSSAQNILIKDLEGGKPSKKESRESNSDADDDYISENNFVKLDLGGLLRGRVGLSYERQFMNRFGVELSVGTILWQDVMSFGANPFASSSDTLVTYKDYQDYNEFNPDFSNLFFGAAFRVYTNDQEGYYDYFSLYRFFAGIEINSFKQSYVMSSDQFNNHTDSRILGVQNFYTGVQVGYLVESDYNATCQEFYLGVGLNNRLADELVYDEYFNGQNYFSGYFAKKEKQKYSSPYFTLGYKIGLKF
jgi:hypothetical protein